MKKIFIIIMLFFPVLCTQTVTASETETETMSQPKINPKNIVGKWQTDCRSLMTGEASAFYDSMKKVNLYFTFLKDMSFQLQFVFEGNIQQEGMGMDLGISVDLSGTYTINKQDQLLLKMTDQKPSINLYKFKLNVNDDIREALSALGMTEDSMKQMMLDEINKDDSFGEMTEKLGTLNIKKLTPTELILSDEEGKQLNFDKVK